MSVIECNRVRLRDYTITISRLRNYLKNLFTITITITLQL